MGVTPDPALNVAPAEVKRIHLVGICGTAMAALAGMLKENGFEVSGSDQNVYPPMSDFLAEQQIPVIQGFRAENLHPQPDLVIVGNVVRATNPEALELARLALPYLSMPQALAHFFLTGKMPLVVCGTHGKTTTSSLLATTLHRVGNTPGFMIGGIVQAFGRNYNCSTSPYYVIEGDEYDTAFFNKVSKFHHYRPKCAICTSIEFDHADIFPDLAAIKASFAKFFTRIPTDGILIANLDDPVIAELTQSLSCPVISYGTGEDCTWRLLVIRPEGLHCEFDFSYKNTLMGPCKLPMPGRHNCLNALSVIAMMHYLDFPMTEILAAIPTFEGVKRRQQIRGEVHGITVVDDFAHHPTAVHETLQALRQAWPSSRLLVAFEPRTNTSRKAVFQKEYASAFDAADLVFVRAPLPLDNVSVEEQFSSKKLADDLMAKGIFAQSFADTDAIIEALAQHAQSGDKIIVLSNGGFDHIHERVLQRLQEVT